MPDSLSVSSLLKYPFKTPGWTNRLLVGTVLLWVGMFVPLVPTVFVFGYMVRVARQVIRGEPLALPEWNDWSRLGLDGLRAAVIGLAYLAPSLIVLVGGWTLYMGVWFGSIFSIEQTGTSPSEAFFALPFLAMAILFLSMFVGFLLQVLGLVPLPAALMRFAAQDRLGAAFHPGKLWAVIRADKWGYLGAWVVMLGIGVLAYTFLMLLYFTVILCAALPILGAPISLYVLLVGAAAFGQVYRESAAQAAQKAPAAVAPLIEAVPPAE